MHSPISTPGDQGFALLLVIWTLAVLAAIAIGVTAESRSDLAIARNSIDAAQAEAAADGGIWRTLAAMLGGERRRQWRADGSFHPTMIGSSSVDIAIQDENGKVDLGRADRQFMWNIVKAVGMEDQFAELFVDTVMEARVGIDSRLQIKPIASGAVDQTQKNAIAATAARLKPLITIHAPHFGIDPATAPPAVLRAVPGVQPADVDAYLRVRDRLPAGAGSLQGFPSLAAAMSYFSWPEIHVVTITARARGPRANFARVAVIDVTGTPSHPYDVVAWETSP